MLNWDSWCRSRGGMGGGRAFEQHITLNSGNSALVQQLGKAFDAELGKGGFQAFFGRFEGRGATFLLHTPFFQVGSLIVQRLFSDKQNRFNGIPAGF